MYSLLVCYIIILLVVSFTINPINQTLPENTTATFFCAPSSDHPEDITWSVYFQDTKKYFVNSEYSHHNEFERHGISFDHNE